MVDCFKYRNKIGVDVALEALRDFRRQKKGTMDELYRTAQARHMALRLLPTATPELNAMAHLWRHVQGRALAHRPVASMDAAAEHACGAILSMSRHERLRKAGGLSGNFGLTK